MPEVQVVTEGIRTILANPTRGVTIPAPASVVDDKRILVKRAEERPKNRILVLVLKDEGHGVVGKLFSRSRSPQIFFVEFRFKCVAKDGQVNGAVRLHVVVELYLRQVFQPVFARLATSKTKVPMTAEGETSFIQIRFDTTNGLETVSYKPAEVVTNEFLHRQAGRARKAVNWQCQVDGNVRVRVRVRYHDLAAHEITGKGIDGHRVAHRVLS